MADHPPAVEKIHPRSLMARPTQRTPSAAGASAAKAPEDSREDVLPAHLHALFQTFPFPAAVLVPEPIVLGVNRAFEELFGWTDGELRGLPLPPGLALSSPERAAGQPAVVEGRSVRGKGGHAVQVRISGFPFESAGREPGCLLVYTDLSRRTRDESQRSRFIQQVIAAQEEERRRIARELHDDTGQSLAAVLVGIMSLIDEVSDARAREKLGQLLFTTSTAIEEVRRMARGLRPSVLDDQGLKAAIEAYAAEFGPRHGIRVDLHIAGLDAERRLPPVLETTVYRVLQEALTNIARHSGATTASVILELRGGQVCTIVEDDGCGFDAGPADSGGAGLGLQGIHERVVQLNGTLEIESRPGRTTLYFRIPLAQP